MYKYNDIINFIKSLFPNQEFIPLHEPRFVGNEKEYVIDAINSTYVSSVGPYVNKFEDNIAKLAGTKHAVATVNGTSALHIALLLAGVKPNDEVLTQALSFIATANAIKYTGADPVFIDVDKEYMGMSPTSLQSFLEKTVKLVNNIPINKLTNRRIAACVPMHTFGLPCDILKIQEICKIWNIPLVEDAAESIGSLFHEKHTGFYGLLGVFSFNGNKTITCGGGGAIVTNDPKLANLGKHLTTQAKIPHEWEFTHDMIAYNYRMPNINAALACAQLEKIEDFVQNKRDLANLYQEFFLNGSVKFKSEPVGARSNYWLNTIQFNNLEERNIFLKESNSSGIMTRPVWTLLHKLPMFKDCQTHDLDNSVFLADRLVNIPSSVRLQ